MHYVSAALLHPFGLFDFDTSRLVCCDNFGCNFGFNSESASIRLLAAFAHFIGLDEQMLADTED